MNQSRLIERYLLLYTPWLLSQLFSYVPLVSFGLAWLGSFYIFYLCYSGRIKNIPSDLPISEQLMRPIFLVHVIFAGYMAMTPIFNLIDIFQLVSFEGTYAPNSMTLEMLAKCQRFYCLGHAAYATGILATLRERTKNFKLVIDDFPSFLIRFTVITLVIARIFLLFPGFSQYYFQLSSLSFISGTMALIYSFKAGRLEYILICSILFILNFLQALLSGFKEPIIIIFLVLGIFIFPFYKKTVAILFIPVMILLFILLPTYNQVFREKAWANEEDADVASDAALAAVTSDDAVENKDLTTWSFLTGRLSEVQMFSGYIEDTPSRNDYYGFSILGQAFEVVIPRIFWPSKPITEELVMERVYNAGVINRNSKVSAKPALIVDGYLSGGSIGIFITCLVFGAATQLISMKAEQLFGGYMLGTALVFSGLFQILWRGLSFEFLINSVVWSYVTMYLIFLILRLLNVLKKVDELHANPDEAPSN